MRLSKLGSNIHSGNYAEESRVLEELEWANKLFNKNKKWVVFNVTNKAIEETATEILRLINIRKNNIFIKNKK
jgi:regulator of PEP synthase PpsR (kinase-PPPase family)